MRLNDLLDRLESAFKRERRFNEDVSHELRTPLSELRTLAELALKKSGSGGLLNPSSRYFEDVLEIAERASEGSIVDRA